jgi:hypothetical protein
MIPEGHGPAAHPEHQSAWAARPPIDAIQLSLEQSARPSLRVRDDKEPCVKRAVTVLAVTSNRLAIRAKHRPDA